MSVIVIVVMLAIMVFICHSIIEAYFLPQMNSVYKALNESKRAWKKDEPGYTYTLSASKTYNGIGINPKTYASRDHISAPEKLEEKLQSYWSNRTAIKFLINHIKDSPSLCKPDSIISSANQQAYLNYFLLALRRTDVTLYKKIVGKAFGYKFLSNSAHTLYRRDQRNSDTIFHKGGFQLLDDDGIFSSNPNGPSTSKTNHTAQNHSSLWTNKHGVSTAKIIPFLWYGRQDPDKKNYSKKTGKYDKPDRYYVIKLPKNHNLLLVDVIGSECNRANLNKLKKDFPEDAKKREELREVNSWDPIPPRYIYARVKDHTFFNSTIRGKVNKVNDCYESSYSVNPRIDLSPRGCY